MSGEAIDTRTPRSAEGEGSGLNVAKGGGHGGSRTGSYER